MSGTEPVDPDIYRYIPRTWKPGQPGFLGSPEETLRRTSQTSLQTGSIGYVLLHEEPTDHCFCCMSAKDFDSSLDDDYNNMIIIIIIMQ